MTTVADILRSVASYINQDPTLPTGTDLTMWIDLINQSQEEWADSYIWRKTLTRTNEVTVNNSQVSVGLPVGFERLLSPVFDYSGGLSNPYRYYEIKPAIRFLKEETEKYVYKMGSEAEGQYLKINPALASGASIVFDYLSRPSSLATLNDAVTCQSDQFLVLRTVSKILSSRSDPRFTIVFETSNTLLGHMMDDEAAETGGEDNEMRSTLERKGFRPGE
jgi:hypothetical protein